MLDSAEAVAVFTRELLNLHRGQGLDILWRDSGFCPTETDYRKMVMDKTGGLFRLAIGLMQCFSQQVLLVS
jgi:geranylgeranyl diphosphate synthase type 3